jgi:hypothetical protein
MTYKITPAVKIFSGKALSIHCQVGGLNISLSFVCNNLNIGCSTPDFITPVEQQFTVDLEGRKVKSCALAHSGNHSITLESIKCNSLIIGSKCRCTLSISSLLEFWLIHRRISLFLGRP